MTTTSRNDTEARKGQQRCQIVRSHFLTFSSYREIKLLRNSQEY